MSSKKGNISKTLDKATAIVSLSSVLLILYIFILFIVKTNIDFNLPIDTEKFGHFGDIIGGLVGTILTFLATILLYYTYKSQREGLKTQKKELELQREELRETRNEFITQNKTSRLQLFDNTFFNMLKVLQELRKEISIDSYEFGLCYNDNTVESKIINGKTFFEFAHKDFECLWKKEYKGEEEFGSTPYDLHNSDYEYESHPSSNGKTIDKSIEQHLKDITDLKYPIFWKKYANYLGDYFRNLYHILKYISNEKSREKKDIVDETEKEIINQNYKKYADILQSQMSYSELFFIFYNAQKYKKMKPYIKEFDFVENLTIKNLLHPKHEKFEGMGKNKKRINYKIHV